MDHHGDIYVCTLPEDVQKKAKEELNEDPAERQSHLDALRNWVIQQPHLTCRTDNIFLLQFLRVAKFSQLRARERLENHLQARSDPVTSKWFTQENSLPQVSKDALQKGIVVVLPERLPSGPFVLVLRTKDFDTTVFSWDDIFVLMTSLFDIVMTTDEVNQVHGCMILVDYENFGLKHMTIAKFSQMKLTTKVWLHGLACRQKGIGYWNTPTIFNAIFEVAKALMSEKMIKRLNFHKSNLSSLHAQIPKAILPLEYGGDAGPLRNAIDYTRDLLERHGDVLEHNATLYLDESKRVAHVDSAQSSFRKLDVN